MEPADAQPRETGQRRSSTTPTRLTLLWWHLPSPPMLCHLCMGHPFISLLPISIHREGNYL
eukprot:UN09386